MSKNTVPLPYPPLPSDERSAARPVDADATPRGGMYELAADMMRLGAVALVSEIDANHAVGSKERVKVPNPLKDYHPNGLSLLERLVLPKRARAD